MPLTYRISTSHHLVLARASGVLTVSEVTDYLKARVEDPDFQAGFDELIDLRDVGYVDIFADGMNRILPVAEASRLRRGQGKVAIIAATDLVYGLARMYALMSQARGSRVQVGVCRDVDAAEEFLNFKPQPYSLPADAAS